MTRAGVARLSTALVASVCLSGLGVAAQGGGSRFSTVLAGDHEVPAVSTVAGGTLTIDIDEGRQEIDWELTYSGLQAAVSQAHIHLGQPGINGGIALWFCKTTQSAPAGTATCPQSGTLSGTFTASSVQAIGTQQITASDFAAAVAFIQKGFAYANVHTAVSTGGEIRGQLQAGGGHK
jgi:CHRD domain